MLSKILNVALSDRAWPKVSLPVGLGGLGGGKIVDVSCCSWHRRVNQENSEH